MSKLILAGNDEPAKNVEEQRWNQLVHKNCKGELVLIAKGPMVGAICKKCRYIWLRRESLEFDWAIREPLKSDAGLWIPS